MSATARDVIANELKDHGADFLANSRDDIADAILSAIDAAGFAIVPKEPTEAMKNANDEIHWSYNCHVCGSLKQKWKAMLAASQEGK